MKNGIFALGMGNELAQTSFHYFGEDGTQGDTVYANNVTIKGCFLVQDEDGSNRMVTIDDRGNLRRQEDPIPLLDDLGRFCFVYNASVSRAFFRYSFNE